jgi:hypothetical protein
MLDLKVILHITAVPTRWIGILPALQYCAHHDGLILLSRLSGLFIRPDFMGFFATLHVVYVSLVRIFAATARMCT